jgi:hypothetical protein
MANRYRYRVAILWRHTVLHTRHLPESKERVLSGSSGSIFLGGNQLAPLGEYRSFMAEGTSEPRGAPIRVGWLSRLRVASGGEASGRLEARRRRSPAHANGRPEIAFSLWEPWYPGPQRRNRLMKKHHKVQEDVRKLTSHSCSDFARPSRTYPTSNSHQKGLV